MFELRDSNKKTVYITQLLRNNYSPIPVHNQSKNQKKWILVKTHAINDLFRPKYQNLDKNCMFYKKSYQEVKLRYLFFL